MKIVDIPTGTRVSKPSAIGFDFAYQRSGTVIREGGRVGVLFDGCRGVIEYPSDTELLIIGEEE